MQLNKYMDHTLLKPNATRTQIQRLCDEAREQGFATVSVNSCWTKFCAKRLIDSGVGVTTCIGFPLGACSTAAKVAEANQAVEDGTSEIDMVLNVGMLLSGERGYCVQDIHSVVKAAQGCEQKVDACKIAVEAGASFVKTSTGFSIGGATIHDVRLMRSVVGDKCKIKAAGGIHTKEEALAMIEAGADRIGASASVAICS